MPTMGAMLRRLKLVIPIAILVCAGAVISAAPPTFSTKRVINSFVNGLLPFDVRTEDIDRDGDMDIYTANYSGRIAWFENDGGHPPGPWVEHILTDFADGAEAVFAVRVDGDADIDFFSAAFNREEIAWYDNGGDGKTWTITPITFDCRLCVDVWAADLDGDGDNDALSASGFDSKIVWYENRDPSGNFWTPHLIGVAGECVEAADLDHDGDLDVAAGGLWFESNGGSPPTFTGQLVVTLPVNVNAEAVVDVDSDGDLDVLSAGQEDDTIAWHENDGALPPHWTTRIVSKTADFATSVYGADLDGDADVDLLSSSFFDSTIAWYENDGGTPPSWTRRTVSTDAQGARSVFAADLEGDGDMDVISASQNDAKVVWHVNDADYPDQDRDGMRDELDCAPADATAFVVPREVSAMRFRSGTRLEWNSAVAGSGSGARYDVVQGALSRPGSRFGETCLVNDAPAGSLTDETNPTIGTAFYYFVRASNACGTGTYGAGSSGVPRNTGVCP